MLATLIPVLVLASLSVQDAATGESDPKAVALLEEFQEQVYDPTAAGLRTLTFDMDMPNPMMGGSMGVLTISWSVDGGTESSFELSEAMQTMVPEAMRDQLTEQMDQTAEQIARIQTNQVVSEILRDMHVELEGQEDGMSKVSCTVIPGRDTSLKDRAMFFDGDGVLARNTQMTQGPMGGEVEEASSMTWTALEATSGKLLLAAIDEKAAGIPQSSTFEHQVFGDFVFVSSIRSEAMGQSMAIDFSNFIVNGEAVKREAPASEEGETEG